MGTNWLIQFFGEPTTFKCTSLEKAHRHFLLYHKQKHAQNSAKHLKDGSFMRK